MGVPKFFRYTSERYPCLNELVKQYQIPDFDNMYLDMNGIIHNCSHPDDSNPHFRITEEKIFKDIFHYISILFQIIKPKKLFFMAIDGVAPRAKMNQQRGRRFRSAREAEDLEEKAKAKGEVLPTEKRFDSNCITPGTVFMARLHEQLRYFVKSKISTDPLWSKVKVILSGHETPGEGEHKIMDYIRWARSQPGYEPDTRHCLYGLDADLIMLGMCTHEPHFALLREEVKFGKTTQRATSPEETNFYLLHLSLMRAYLEQEFISIKNKLPFPYDIEKIVDDWVLMGFLVGNDFIPHLPNMHINNDALPLLYKTYMNVLPTLDGYINESGDLNLVRFEIFMQELAKIDKEKFQDTYADLKYFEGKTGRRPNAMERKEYKPNNDDTFNINIEDIKANKPDDELQALINATQEMYMDDVDNDDEYDETSDEEATMEMEFLLHKKDYYMNKLDYSKVTDEVLADQAEGYVRAVQWNLYYYYKGCPSWCWYYPHHYAPYISDIRGFKDLKFDFELGEPFKPFEQLLAVLPAASKHLLPTPFHDLMTDEDSPIVHYYPLHFETDLNGKKNDWEAVVLIPFIDEVRDLTATAVGDGRGLPIVHYYPLHFETDLNGKKNDWEAVVLIPFIDEVRDLTATAVGDGRGLPIVHYYPLHFETDLNGKKNDWEAVVLIPFIDETNLLSAMAPCYQRLTEEELKRNTHGPMLVYNWTPENLGQIPAPQYFPPLAANHATETAVWRSELDVRDEQLVRGMLPNVNREIVFPGFPTMRYMDFKTSIKKVKVKVFDQPSRNESMIIELLPTDSTDPPLELVAERLLGRVCWVGWPHLTRAKIISVSNEKKRLHHVEQHGDSAAGGAVSCEPNAGNLHKQWLAERCTLVEHNMNRLGIELGEVNVIVHAVNLRGYKYAIQDNVSMVLEEEWCKVACGYALQSVVAAVATHPRPPAKFLTPRDAYPPGDHCFLLTNGQYYGCMATVKVPTFMPFHKTLSQGKPQDVVKWIKKQPHSNAMRRECGSDALEPEEMRVLYSNLRQQLDRLQQQEKSVTLHVKWNLLYKPELHEGNIQPDPKADFKMYDRVVCVARSITAPLGAKGTVTAVYAPADGNTVRLSDKMNAQPSYQVMFDEPFDGAQSEDLFEETRFYRMLPTNMLNISFGRKLRGSVSCADTQPFTYRPTVLRREDGHHSAFASYSPPREIPSPAEARAAHHNNVTNGPQQDNATSLLKSLLKISETEPDSNGKTKSLPEPASSWRIKNDTQKTSTPKAPNWRAQSKDSAAQSQPPMPPYPTFAAPPPAPFPHAHPRNQRHQPPPRNQQPNSFGTHFANQNSFNNQHVGNQTFPKHLPNVNQAMTLGPAWIKGQSQPSDPVESAASQPGADKLNNPFIPLQAQARRQSSSGSSSRRDVEATPAPPPAPVQILARPPQPIQQQQTTARPQRKKKTRIAANLPFQMD
ncbi:5'-3' exoribonuclease 1 [Bicyclus anynana]|uniref:5'-3' exoribonuclease 1 n=1 Tax=Bicyclus anynana TaxID=110368 RepID=A0ABM3LGZ5_BICAN|nr:5'-3' exoribonuclease 1 [Bicyclus anynana]